MSRGKYRSNHEGNGETRLAHVDSFGDWVLLRAAPKEVARGSHVISLVFLANVAE